MGTRTANTVRSAAAAKGDDSKGNKRTTKRTKTEPKASVEPVQNTATIHFTPTTPDKDGNQRHVTKTKFRYQEVATVVTDADTGEKIKMEAVGAFYVNQDFAAALGIAEGDSVSVIIKRRAK